MTELLPLLLLPLLPLLPPLLQPDLGQAQISTMHSHHTPVMLLGQLLHLAVAGALRPREKLVRDPGLGQAK